MRPRFYDSGGPVTSGAVVRCNSQTFEASAKSWHNLSFSTAGASDCSTVTTWPLWPNNVAEFGIINSNAELAALTDVTWEAWINLSGAGPGYATVVSKWAQLGGMLVGTVGHAGFYDPGGVGIRLGGTQMAVGQWYHVAISCSTVTSTGTIYLNGQVDGSGAYSVGATTTWPVYFGKMPGSWPLNGQIKACRVYNRALAGGEIKRNYNASRARYP